MIASFKLIKELVDLPADLTLEDLVERLTFSGLEVEDFHPLAAGDHLCIGRITACRPHPESDHLHLLEVDCGSFGTLPIVCGAPNARAGIKVIVARPGARLPAKNIVIKPTSIAGHQSEGMCCSLSELGVAPELLSEAQLSGIEELPADAPVGSEQVLEYLGLDDCVLDINVLANRPDLLSMIGLAREVAALFDRPLKAFDLPPLQPVNRIEVGSSSLNCRSFRLLEVRTDGRLTRSPEPLARYLRALGYRPISLSVDLGNFIMAISGQPFHFYDLDKVAKLGPTRFQVRDDIAAPLETLDGKTVETAPGDIVVTNGSEPLCLGGVMGLANVACDEGSTHFGIEAASFAHAAIRHTVSRTGLASDSSNRFAKKVNPALAEESLRLLAAAYRAIDPSFAIVSYSVYDQEERQEVRIPYDLARINRRLGSDFSDDEARGIFRRLRIKLESGWLVPPADRPDLKEPADIEEELFRYNSPERLDQSLKGLPITHGRLTPRQNLIRRAREFLIARGLFETLSYTLIDQKTDLSCRVFQSEPGIRISNPMTSEHEIARSELLGSLVRTARYNRDRKKADFGLFEISDCDLPSGEIRTYLALALSGQRPEQGALGARPYDFYDAKGLVLALLQLAGLDEKRLQLKAEGPECFHPGRVASIWAGRELLGVVGEISPRVEKERLLAAELDLTRIIGLKSSPVRFAPLSIYPVVERDYCFVLDSSIGGGELLTVIKKSVGSVLKLAEIFDVYAIDEKENSMAVKLKLLAYDHTFQEEELKDISERVIKVVGEKLKGRLR